MHPSYTMHTYNIHTDIQSVMELRPFSKGYLLWSHKISFDFCAFRKRHTSGLHQFTTDLHPSCKGYPMRISAVCYGLLYSSQPVTLAKRHKYVKIRCSFKGYPLQNVQKSKETRWKPKGHPQQNDVNTLKTNEILRGTLRKMHNDQ